LNADFAINPQTVINNYNTAYGWLASDGQPGHTGLLVLNGTVASGSFPGSFVDLTVNSGPQSIGLVMPQPIGGIANTQYPGWSFEVVIKFQSTVQQTWSKFFQFGNGPNNDLIDLSWDASTNTLCAEIYNSVAQGPRPPLVTNLLSVFWSTQPTLNTWYHIMWVMKPTNTTIGTGTWIIYVNGIQTLNSAGLYPFPLIRIDSFIGGSDWGDTPISATYDVLRVYNYAMPLGSIPALANLYGLNNGILPTPSSTGPGVTTTSSSTGTGPGATTTSSSSSSLSGGAIAGIVIGSVVGAILLCAIIFAFCCGARGSKNKSASDGNESTGKWDQMEHSSNKGEGGDGVEMTGSDNTTA